MVVQASWLLESVSLGQALLIEPSMVKLSSPALSL